MANLSVFLAHEAQLRLINRLETIHATLLSNCLFGRDFYPRMRTSSVYPLPSSTIDYQCAAGTSLFSPILIGSVKSISPWVRPYTFFTFRVPMHLQECGLGVDLQLGLHPHPTHAVDVVFWNQVATLHSIVEWTDRHVCMRILQKPLSLISILFLFRLFHLLDYRRSRHCVLVISLIRSARFERRQNHNC